MHSKHVSVSSQPFSSSFVCLNCPCVLSVCTACVCTYVCAGFQAFADPDTGAVTAVDADISFNSNSVRLVVVGRGPLGAFTAKVSAVQMDGRCDCSRAGREVPNRLTG